MSAGNAEMHDNTENDFWVELNNIKQSEWTKSH
jgi:hypothetical protein